MFHFSTCIPDCDSLLLLDFFLSSESSICSTIAFTPLGNSDHVCVSASINFLPNSQGDAQFHWIAYDYSCAYWDGVCDHLRDIPWEDILKLSASSGASEFCGWIHVGTDVYIPHLNFQIIPYSHPWSSAACALLPEFIEIMYFVSTNQV